MVPLITLAVAGFSFLDWGIVFVYMGLVIAIGFLAGRKKHAASDDGLLAGRRMPMWAVAISILATSQSAATFVGGPQQAYEENLTYLAANFGALLAVVIVAAWFIPAYYRSGVTSIYEIIGNSCGPVAQRMASGMFLLGRVFASGARLYIVAIPFALITFGGTSPGIMYGSILLIAVIATGYTLMGGIRAVIWTDVLQAGVYVGAVGCALVLLWNKIPVGVEEMVEVLRQAEGGDKLIWLDTGWADEANPNALPFWSRPYSLWGVLIGLTLFNLAAYGTDQDLTQRMLTCRTERKGSGSVILAALIGWPVVGVFLLMGLLLFVFYQSPGLMGNATPAYAPSDTRRIFLHFILQEIPTGLKGLMLAGLFAAAMSSMDSALNAMATATVADFYRPLVKRRKVKMTSESRVLSIASVGWAGAIAMFACLCVHWQQGSGQTLIDFALGVMVFAYAGLLGVFLTVLFTKRGNARSVGWALGVGFLAVLVMKPYVWSWFNHPEWSPSLAFSWQMAIATGLSFGVCASGSRHTQSMKILTIS